MSERLISVVVPAYNAEGMIGDCVAALQRQDFDGPCEIIVVDDGSTDGTAAEAERAGTQVITIPNSRPAAARNVGIRAAQGEIVCVTDADCIPHPDWLRQITAPFDDPAVVACKGTYTTTQPQLVARFVQLEYEDKYDLLRGKETIDFIDTYSAAYRRDVLLANNGFDEWFDYLEDQELSFRLAARGYRMVFQEPAVVAHRHSATPAAYLRKKGIIGYWKAQVVSRFPGRAARDSHTPQVMKVQMALAVLFLLALAAGVVGAVWLAARGDRGWLALLPALAVALLFAATTLPFVRKAWGKDRPVALASPLLLFGRAAALSAGYAWGVVNPRRMIPEVATVGGATISGASYYAKRVMDIAGALLGLIFTVITLPLIWLLIKLDSEGPVIFRQERVGERGEPFIMYKFRTMHADAAERWPELVASLGLTEPVLKLENDPRLTRVGQHLRRRSLDELPQFWNVLKGEMSLVGPRPEEPRIVAYYDDTHRRRLAVRPGMTGPMQIDDRPDLNLDQRAALDLDYIENYSLRRDVAILLRTLPVVIRGKGVR